MAATYTTSSGPLQGLELAPSGGGGHLYMGPWPVRSAPCGARVFRPLSIFKVNKNLILSG
jgi:hypothetical protein